MASCAITHPLHLSCTMVTLCFYSRGIYPMSPPESSALLFPGAVPARYWHKLDDGRLQCDLCPRFCHLHEGQRGACFVRARRGEELVLTTYGRSSGFCLDPLEKKPLNHFYPGSPVLSFGTAGCNLSCRFCQNWDISKSRSTDKLQSVASPDSIAAAAVNNNAIAVAYTYNDPVIFHEYAVDTAIACHERDIFNIAVTAGYVCPEPRSEFYRYMDAVNVDLKAFTPRFYKQLCAADLDAVLDTLRYIRHETRVWLEITVLLIPDENDSEAELNLMSAWLADNMGPDVPVFFTAFHPDFKMQDKPRTPAETLMKARHIALQHGLHYVYTGNMHDSTGGSTWCPGCHHRIIGRDWYELSEWQLQVDTEGRGTCAHCQTPIAGVFAEKPGTWGRKRARIKFRPAKNQQA